MQFESKHLTHNMFSVVEGIVTRVVPALGSKVINRDGTVTMNKDIAVAFQGSVLESKQQPRAASKGLDPQGYR